MGRLVGRHQRAGLQHRATGLGNPRRFRELLQIGLGKAIQPQGPGQLADVFRYGFLRHCDLLIAPEKASLQWNTRAVYQRPATALAVEDGGRRWRSGSGSPGRDALHEWTNRCALLQGSGGPLRACLDRLTVWQPASAPESLMIILFVAAIVLPTIAVCTISSYSVFRGKARDCPAARHASERCRHYARPSDCARP